MTLRLGTRVVVSNELSVFDGEPAVVARPRPGQDDPLGWSSVEFENGIEGVHSVVPFMDKELKVRNEIR